MTDYGIEPINLDDLDGERLEIYYLPLDLVLRLRWKDNPKNHDIGGVVQSIQQNGFRDPPSYDSNLQNQVGDLGALVEGNGRPEALGWMFQQQMEVPRGILVHKQSGEWHVPVHFGLDAESQMAAARYAVDHNNLTMSGGDFTAADMARMWDREAYANLNEMLIAAGTPAVTLDADDFAGLQEAWALELMGDDEDDSEKSDGSLLELTNVTIDEPENTVTPGEVWQVGRHVLVCASVVQDWASWVQYLTEGVLFMPYAGPFALVSEAAAEFPLLLVQPDPYIAGHMLDRYIETAGESSVEKLT